jgi:Recombination endonuclease VII
MANHKKQYCPEGHDTFVVGRLNGSCRVCRKETSRIYYREFNQKAKASIKIWADSHKDQKKDSTYQRTYGITLDDYRMMVSQQEGRCRICTEYKPLVVDHCHDTGKVRGLLCSQCNRAMGLFGDDPIRLQSAVQYLS